VLRVLADEWLAHGVCDRSLNELGARAGVCRTLAKRTIKLAEVYGLISVQRRPRSGRKHLANIIRIIRAEWIDWLRKGNRKAHAVKACSRFSPGIPYLRVRGYHDRAVGSGGLARGDRGRAVADLRRPKTLRRG
jgi:hypothetical protein